MNIHVSEREGGVVLLKEWTTHSLSRGLVIKLRSQMPIFLTVSVVEVTPLLSISVCWFGFGCR